MWYLCKLAITFFGERMQVRNLPYLKHGLSDDCARLFEIAQFDETTIGRFAFVCQWQWNLMIYLCGIYY